MKTFECYTILMSINLYLSQQLYNIIHMSVNIMWYIVCNCQQFSRFSILSVISITDMFLVSEALSLTMFYISNSPLEVLSVNWNFLCNSLLYIKYRYSSYIIIGVIIRAYILFDYLFVFTLNTIDILCIV